MKFRSKRRKLCTSTVHLHHTIWRKKAKSCNQRSVGQFCIFIREDVTNRLVLFISFSSTRVRMHIFFFSYTLQDLYIAYIYSNRKKNLIKPSGLVVTLLLYPSELPIFKPSWLWGIIRKKCNATKNILILAHYFSNKYCLVPVSPQPAKLLYKHLLSIWISWTWQWWSAAIELSRTIKWRITDSFVFMTLIRHESDLTSARFPHWSLSVVSCIGYPNPVGCTLEAYVEIYRFLPVSSKGPPPLQAHPQLVQHICPHRWLSTYSWNLEAEKADDIWSVTTILALWKGVAVLLVQVVRNLYSSSFESRTSRL